MKKWNIRHKIRSDKQEVKNEKLIEILLEQRGIIKKKDKQAFLEPELEAVTLASVGIDTREVQKTLDRLQQTIATKEQIIIFGDYDVDGITGTAILWETLHALGFNVLPYIPHRVEEGYGLSIKGIDQVIEKYPLTRLIITVDNGIVAHEAVAYANAHGIDVIITDHHLPEGDEKRPEAYTIVHTTKLCGASVAWLLSQEIKMNQPEGKKKLKSDDNAHLELAALGTIADLVPLLGANRTIVKFGLEKLRNTARIGLQALFQEAGIEQSTIGTYEVGYIISPRLNAAGRIESAMDSLRLVCTKDKKKALDLAQQLGQVNRERQTIMKETTLHALTNYKMQIAQKEQKKIIFIGHETYNPGVIGLVAGKLVEEFYRPAIVLSIGETHAKASVRSIKGVNIIELLRTHADMYINVGGHPMAAGFTVEVAKMDQLKDKLERVAESVVTEELLQRSLEIDCELELSLVDEELYRALQQLAPFGMGNPEPVFVSRGVVIDDIRFIGREKNHVKLRLQKQKVKSMNQGIDAIGFGLAEQCGELQVGDKIDIVYTIDENVWNGNVSLQLKLKVIKIVN